MLKDFCRPQAATHAVKVTISQKRCKIQTLYQSWTRIGCIHGLEWVGLDLAKWTHVQLCVVLQTANRKLHNNGLSNSAISSDRE